MFLRQTWRAVVLAIVASTTIAAQTAPLLRLQTNDVVAFVGGADVAAAQFTGHLEAILAVQFPGARFRNFGWEGDTVFAQPREFGFPPLAEHLQRSGVTVVVMQFGRGEALSGKQSVPAFLAACEKFVAACLRQTPRIVVVTPPPFERGEGLLPDLSEHNSKLAAHANALRTLSQQRGLPLVDLFGEFGGTAHEEPRLTDNGLQLTPQGQALIASGFARQSGFGNVAALAESAGADGAWTNKEWEKLRHIVIEKNRLWFNYWRPQNWAFLGGDRITQPSSRDHRNPQVRWFPAEMEKYRPLIQEKEAEMERLAANIRGKTQ